LAHINVRWELRFHGMTRTESGKKAGSLRAGSRVRVRPGESPIGNISAATISLFNYITRIEGAPLATCFALIRPMHAARMLGGRAGAIPPAAGARSAAASHVIEFSAHGSRPVSPPPMSLEFQLMACSAVGFPTVPHAPGRDTRP
jgi:hypothetical protein